MQHLSYNCDDCNSEDYFWNLAPQAEAKGIKKSLLGRLLKVTQDYEKSTKILKLSLSKRNPLGYISKTIKNLEDEKIGPLTVLPTRSNEPEIALDARLRGWPVRATIMSNGKPGWWVAGTLYDSKGYAVGG